MSPSLKTILVTVALGASVSAPVQADEPEDTMIVAATNASQPATDGALWAALRAADAYWLARGLTPPACGEASVRVYDEPELSTGRAWGRADPNGCVVYIDRSWLRSVRKDMSRGYITAWKMVGALMIHERGHNYGLDHVNSGVMTPDFKWWRIPEVNRWARAQYRRYVLRRTI